MARKNPTPATLRNLSIRSGNQCAFTSCTEPLLDAAENYVAELCHIEAAMPQGPRFNPLQSDDQRRSPENLLYLCHKHHVETHDPIKYPASKLRAMKTAHEALPEVAFDSDLLLKRVAEVLAKQDEFSTLLQQKFGDQDPPAKNYAIRGPEGENAWIPDQGRFYTYSFGDGSAFKLMAKDGWIHLEQTLPDGTIAYYEVNERGGVRESRFPHLLREYVIDIPGHLVLREQQISSSIGDYATETILKWSKGSVIQHFSRGELIGLDIHARSRISHPERRITVVG